MNTEQQPTRSAPPRTPPDPPPPAQEQPAWGAPPPPPEQRPKWSVRRTVIAVAIAVGIAAAGGAAIYAASGSVDNATGPNGAGGPGGGRMVMGGPMADLDHGEFQNGEVKAIGDSSITVESEDGYEGTYTIGDDTQQSDDIATGDEVMVVATTDGDTATAVTIMEAGAMPQRQNGPDGGRPPMNGDQGDGN